MLCLAEKRKKKNESSDEGKKNGSGDGSKSEDGEIADYMDHEMKEFDERSKQRVEIIFREFKNEIEAYIPPGSEKAKAGWKFFILFYDTYAPNNTTI